MDKKFSDYKLLITLINTEKEDITNISIWLHIGHWKLRRILRKCHLFNNFAHKMFLHWVKLIFPNKQVMSTICLQQVYWVLQQEDKLKMKFSISRDTALIRCRGKSEPEPEICHEQGSRLWSNSWGWRIVSKGYNDCVQSSSTESIKAP